MKKNVNSDRPASKRLCARCVGESFLKALITEKGIEDCCSYCDRESKTFTIQEMADLIETAFDDHYERTPTEPDGYEWAMQSDPDSNYQWEREGEEVLWAIASAAKIEEEPASDILSVLAGRHYDHEAAKMGEERPFDNESYYARKKPADEEFLLKWDEFENGLKTEARYFSRSAQATLCEIFTGVATLRTNGGSPVVVAAGPEMEIKSLHRARVFAGEDEKLEEALKRPWGHLGPPPTIAAAAGRMNARGISVFYGALEWETALAEVRPAVGSKVAVAKFLIERPLRLLDVEALKSVVTSGSIFDPNYTQQLLRAEFLATLSARISRPVMPNEEASEYLATQAVADYLATEANLDGIIFPSVQVGHTSSNVVLFHHSSRVAEIQLPKGTELSARLEEHNSDGVFPEYNVWETVPNTPTEATPSQSASLDLLISPLPLNWRTAESRSVSLSIDLNNITIHHITAAKFTATEYPVARHRLFPPKSSPF